MRFVWLLWCLTCPALAQEPAASEPADAPVDVTEPDAQSEPADAPVDVTEPDAQSEPVAEPAQPAVSEPVDAPVDTELQGLFGRLGTALANRDFALAIGVLALIAFWFWRRFHAKTK